MKGGGGADDGCGGGKNETRRGFSSTQRRRRQRRKFRVRSLPRASGCFLYFHSWKMAPGLLARSGLPISSNKHRVHLPWKVLSKGLPLRARRFSPMQRQRRHLTVKKPERAHARPPHACSVVPVAKIRARRWVPFAISFPTYLSSKRPEELHTPSTIRR